MANINVLEIEENSSDGKQATSLLDLLEIPYQLITVSKGECENKLPMLLNNAGIFPGLKNIEWYIKTYGRESSYTLARV